MKKLLASILLVQSISSIAAIKVCQQKEGDYLYDAAYDYNSQTFAIVKTDVDEGTRQFEYYGPGTIYTDTSVVIGGGYTLKVGDKTYGSLYMEDRGQDALLSALLACDEYETSIDEWFFPEREF